MAKKKTKVTSMAELTEVISHSFGYISAYAKNVEQKLGSGAYMDIMERGLSAMARPMARDMQQFVSKGQHYQSGATLGSFNPGTIYTENGFIKYKLGFDMNDGGFPALILEYGDNGSPMRMPNEPYFFIYKAVKSHKIDEGEKTAIMTAILKDYEKFVGQ